MTDQNRDNIDLTDIAIIGAGPSGLICADILSQAGLMVTVYERLKSPGRKFLMAGRGGLNLTHSEPIEAFMCRYAEARHYLAPMIHAFGPKHLMDWADALGAECFIGSSGRVFPRALKAAPLLRALLKRLSDQNVTFCFESEFKGFGEYGEIHLQQALKPITIRPYFTILAMGGASWPRLGTDGSWATGLRQIGVDITDFAPSNMGIKIDWPVHFKARFEGQPLKTIALSHDNRRLRSDVIITKEGLEGTGIYALSASVREALVTKANTTLMLDLKPDLSHEVISQRLSAQPKAMSASNILRKALRLDACATALVLNGPKDLPLADRVKSLPLEVIGTQGLERAISSAGGVSIDGLNPDLSLKMRPTVFCVGEMLDWEAPTGGYLLQGAFSSGVHVARTIIERLMAPLEKPPFVA